MKKILRGGCLCGSLQYEYSDEPGESSYCHCDDCRKATGGPYTVGVLVQATKLRIVSGQVKGYTTRGDSGRWITREFCPQCGSPLFTRAEKYPDLVWLKAGCLEESEQIKPSCQTWTKCAVPWAYIDEHLPCYPESGPSKTDDSQD